MCYGFAYGRDEKLIVAFTQMIQDKVKKAPVCIFKTTNEELQLNLADPVSATIHFDGGLAVGTHMERKLENLKNALGCLKFEWRITPAGEVRMTILNSFESSSTASNEMYLAITALPWREFPQIVLLHEALLANAIKQRLKIFPMLFTLNPNAACMLLRSCKQVSGSLSGMGLEKPVKEMELFDTHDKYRCYRCKKELNTIDMSRGGLTLGAAMPLMYNGVVCQCCKKLECMDCKGNPADAPCSACGGTVSPAFAHLL